MSAQHAKWLREAAEQIATAGHNGWGNTCTCAADHIDQLVAQLAAERARADALQARVAQWEYSAKYDDIHYYALKADRDRLRAAIITRAPQLLTDAPCVLCGYNGPGYYQPETHSCMAEYHAAQRAALKEGQ